MKIAEIARVQAIPQRFLEVILNQLKQAGFVKSIRGSKGGYILSRAPRALSVGDVIQFIQGPEDANVCTEGSSQKMCPLYPECIFLPMWDRAQRAVSEVYNQTSFGDLLEEERAKKKYVPSYSI